MDGCTYSQSNSERGFSMAVAAVPMGNFQVNKAAKRNISQFQFSPKTIIQSLVKHYPDRRVAVRCRPFTEHINSPTGRTKLRNQFMREGRPIEVHILKRNFQPTPLSVAHRSPSSPFIETHPAKSNQQSSSQPNWQGCVATVVQC